LGHPCGYTLLLFLTEKPALIHLSDDEENKSSFGRWVKAVGIPFYRYVFSVQL
jgi:hypothetical protein